MAGKRVSDSRDTSASSHDAPREGAPSREEIIETVASMIDDIGIGMLTTVDDDGGMRSRPMATQRVERSEGLRLWFFTRASAPKVDEVDRTSVANVSYAEPKTNDYVSVSGPATVVTDRRLIEEMWTADNKAWFPKGLEDPDIALLEVDVDKAEYWRAPSSTIVYTVGLLKALTTGKSYDPGENEKITLPVT